MNWSVFILLCFSALGTAFGSKVITDTAHNEGDAIEDKFSSENKNNGVSPMFFIAFDEQYDENSVEAIAGEETEVIMEFLDEISAADSNSSIAFNTTSLAVANCTVGKLGIGLSVELVNGSKLLSLLKPELNITKRSEAGDCVAVLLYAPYCPFSSMAAPHFNALARAFPDIRMVALNAMKHHSFNTEYGVVGVPSLMLFHNGRPVAKFNDSEYNLEMFSKFLSKYSGLESQGKLFVTSADFAGPLPSAPVKETDYCLVLAWVFILICGIHFFTKSSWWRWIVETIQNTWREAEAQHEHEE